MCLYNTATLVKDTILKINATYNHITNLGGISYQE